MGLHELIASLAEEAEAEKDGILRGAREEAAAIVAQARRELDEYRQGPLSDASRRLEAEQAKRLHAARMEASGRSGEAKRDILTAVTMRVGELIDELSLKDEYEDCLCGLLREAVTGLAGGTVKVRPKDMHLLAQKIKELKGDFKLVPDENMSAGIIAISEDGLVEIDNTLRVRLGRYMVYHEAEVSKKLFRGQEHG